LIATDHCQWRTSRGNRQPFEHVVRLGEITSLQIVKGRQVGIADRNNPVPHVQTSIRPCRTFRYCGNGDLTPKPERLLRRFPPILRILRSGVERYPGKFALIRAAVGSRTGDAKPDIVNACILHSQFDEICHALIHDSHSLSIYATPRPSKGRGRRRQQCGDSQRYVPFKSHLSPFSDVSTSAEVRSFRCLPHRNNVLAARLCDC
jgi:hypothetical protein